MAMTEVRPWSRTGIVTMRTPRTARYSRLLTERVTGRQVTFDDIEHTILQPTFQAPLVQIALNCASVSCLIRAAATTTVRSR